MTHEIPHAKTTRFHKRAVSLSKCMLDRCSVITQAAKKNVNRVKIIFILFLDFNRTTIPIKRIRIELEIVKNSNKFGIFYLKTFKR